MLQRNVARLADYDLAFDLQVFAGRWPVRRSLRPRVRASRSSSNTPACSKTARPEAARSGGPALERLAARPNVVSKLSAFGTFIHRNDPAHIGGILRDTVAMFGADRCLFGSNFPIEKLWTGYRALIDAFLAAASDLDDTARAAIFEETAAQVYRL